MRGLSPRGSIIARSDFITSIALSTAVVAFDTPAGARDAIFGATGNFAISYGTTSAVFPAATSTAGSTGSEINPLARDFGSTANTTGGSVVGTTAGGFLTIAWYSNGG